jgi:hypothetical protein
MRPQGTGLLTPESEKKFALDPRWKAVPDKYYQTLHDANVPTEDLPFAVQALQNIENKHPTAQTVSTSLDVASGLAIPGEGISSGLEGITKAIGLGGKGALPTVGRFLVKPALITAAVNGPEAVSQAITNKDPELTTELILKDVGKDYLYNLAFHAGGTALGHGIAYGQSLAGKTPMDLMAGVKGYSMTGQAEPGVVEAAQLRRLGVSDPDINDMTGQKGPAGYDASQTLDHADKYLPKYEEQNNSELGKNIQKLGPQATDEIKNATKELDELSKPNSKVNLDTAHDLTQIPESTAARNFSNDYLKEHYNQLALNGKTTLSFDEWKSTASSTNDVGKVSSDAQSQFDKAKAGKIPEEQWVNDRLEHVFKQIDPLVEAKNAVAEAEAKMVAAPDKSQNKLEAYKVWEQKKAELADTQKNLATRNTAQDFFKWKTTDPNGKVLTENAMQDYKNIRQYGPDSAKPITSPGDNYNARADGLALKDGIEARLRTATGADEVRTIKNAMNSIGKKFGPNNRISPSDMADLETHFREQIPNNAHDVLGDLKRSIHNEVKKQLDLSNARIAGSHPDVLAKLESANQKLHLFQITNGGADLLTKTAKVSTGTTGRIPVGSTGVLHFAIRTVLKPFRAMSTNYWEQKGSKQFGKAMMRYVSKDQNVKMQIIDNQIKHQQFLKTIPTMLTATVAQQQNIRNEKKNFDGLKVLLGDQANGLSKSQQYAAVLKALTEVDVPNQQAALASTLGDNQLSGIAARTIAAIHGAILDAMQKNSAPIPFAKNDPAAPTKQKLNDLNDVVRLVNNPEELLKDYQDKSITEKKVNLIKTIFPAQYADMIQAVWMQNNNIETTYQNRMLLGILTGMKTDPSLNNVPALQAGLHPPTPQGAPQGGGGKVSHGKGAKGGSGVDTYEPKNQKTGK